MADKARVRIVHNVAGGPNVDVYANNGKVLSNVSYKTVSDYLCLDQGFYCLQVTLHGSSKVILKEEVRLDNRDYTAIVHGSVQKKDCDQPEKPLAILFLSDNNDLPEVNKSHVRFVHAAADAPAVDIWANSASRIFQNVSYGSTGNPEYLPVDANVYELAVSPADSADVVLGPGYLNLESQEIYTLIATGIPGECSKFPLTVLILVDYQRGCCSC